MQTNLITSLFDDKLSGSARRRKETIKGPETLYGYFLKILIHLCKSLNMKIRDDVSKSTSPSLHLYYLVVLGTLEILGSLIQNAFKSLIAASCSPVDNVGWYLQQCKMQMATEC